MKAHTVVSRFMYLLFASKRKPFVGPLKLMAFGKEVTLKRLSEAGHPGL